MTPLTIAASPPHAAAPTPPDSAACFPFAETARLFAAARVLDGGLATQLEEGYHCDLNNSLWSTSILEAHPEIIQSAHADFVRAGCDVLITCTYQTSLQGFDDDADRFHRSLLRAAALARRAAEDGRTSADSCTSQSESCERKVLVAGSLGPYGACLAGGQEYTGEYGLAEQLGLEVPFANPRHEEGEDHVEKRNLLRTAAEVTFLKQWHLPRARALLPVVDLFAGETCPKISEAVALSTLFADLQKPGYVSFQCRNGRQLASGERIEDAVAALKRSQYLLGVGVNCTAIECVEELVARIKTKTEVRILVYPNSGEEYCAETKTWAWPAAGGGGAAKNSFGEYAISWRNCGAGLIGGCCRVRPAHIREVCAEVSEGKAESC